MFGISFPFKLSVLFATKKCPRCGQKMKMRFSKRPYTDDEKKQRKRVLSRGKLNLEEMNGFLIETFIVCTPCKIVFDVFQFKKMRKKQLNKCIFLTEDELTSIYGN